MHNLKIGHTYSNVDESDSAVWDMRYVIAIFYVILLNILIDLMKYQFPTSCSAQKQTSDYRSRLGYTVRRYIVWYSEYFSNMIPLS